MMVKRVMNHNIVLLWYYQHDYLYSGIVKVRKNLTWTSAQVLIVLETFRRNNMANYLYHFLKIDP